MTNKYPCFTCLVRAACTSTCDSYFGYYGKLIEAYTTSEDTSELIRTAEDELPWNFILYFKSVIEKCIRNKELIELKHWPSGDIYVFNLNGKLMKKEE
ncbi:MAG: hypothetical protein ACFFG0_03970 [Candidatus Thorarchaeota archaeon]